jgi:hypothetical protein
MLLEYNNVDNHSNIFSNYYYTLDFVRYPYQISCAKNNPKARTVLFIKKLKFEGIVYYIVSSLFAKLTKLVDSFLWTLRLCYV